MRFITPILFFAAGAWVWWYNANHLDRVVLVHIFDWVAPSTKGDVALQGRLTAYLAFALGTAFLIRDLVWLARERRSV